MAEKIEYTVTLDIHDVRLTEDQFEDVCEIVEANPYILGPAFSLSQDAGRTLGATFQVHTDSRTDSRRMACEFGRLTFVRALEEIGRPEFGDCTVTAEPSHIPNFTGEIVYQQIGVGPEEHESSSIELDFDKPKPSKPVPQGPKPKAA